MRRDFRRFRRQFQRFLFTLSGCVRDVVRYDRNGVIYAVGAALIGTGLQAVSLGGVLVVARTYEEGLRAGAMPAVEIPLLPPVPAGYAFLGIVILLAASVIVLYEAERMIYTLSVRYGNHRAAELLTDYPLMVECTAGPAVDAATGTPLALHGEMRQCTTRLSRAARTLLGGAMALMQFAYGVAFLLYIQPVLAVLLGVITLPMLVPLRWFTRAVNDAEKGRRALSNKSGPSVSALVAETRRHISRARAHGRELRRRFDDSPIARSNLFILQRFVNIARSKATANAALAVMIAGSIAFFFGIYGAEDVSIASVVVFFIALRVAAMSARQLTSRSARFARFYEPVRHFLLARRHLRARRFPAGGPLRVRLPRADASGEHELVLERGVPLAMAGLFPLAPVNAYLLAVFDSDGGTTRGDLAAGMFCVPAEPEIDPGVTWRDWLLAAPGQDCAALLARARSECPAGAVPGVGVSPDSPVHAGRDSGDPDAWRIDLALLAAWTSSAPVIVLPEGVIEGLSAERRNAWLAALADRYLVTYYRLGDAPVPRAGESWCVLVDAEGKGVAVAGAEWLRANVGEACRLVQVEVAPVEGYGAEEDEDDED